MLLQEDHSIETKSKVLIVQNTKSQLKLHNTFDTSDNHTTYVLLFCPKESVHSIFMY